MRDYGKTVNLPSTSFSMKADLLRKEPLIQAQWEKQGLYRKVRRARAGRPKFILHDGPPYPTGALHVGTGMNKVLKDMVVRYKTMQGFDAPYVPGFDCHGHPIEFRVMQELGPAIKQMSPMQIRERCLEYATNYVGKHSAEFKALGVWGDWENCYLTIDKEYEASELELFADIVAGGFIYRALRPVHWCMSCETALAEAELEYQELESYSIYVAFEFRDALEDVLGGGSEAPASILFWTTTPWTLPANLAIAIHPDFDYALAEFRFPSGPRKLILAEELVERVAQALAPEAFKVLSRCKGRQLEHKRYLNALTGRILPVLLAEYVTLEEGTGCVHTAPGHGTEDYGTGREYGLEILSPVGPTGVFNERAGEFAGLTVFEAEPRICERLAGANALLKQGKLLHSYPHCWRCKKPVIFRATEQWFLAMDHKNLREKLLEAAGKVRWFPEQSAVRFTSMLRQSPDWCISRQKFWGVPIPAFYCKSCGKPFLTEEAVRAFAALVRKEGSSVWFLRTPEEMLPEGAMCPDCGSREFRKETDIFDVWFDAGSSHRGVLRRYEGLSFPADLYLEGSDQHRGWFQKALVTAVASRGEVPYRQVLAHGLVVGETGEKMSKSRGGFVSVDDALSEFGAEIIRLWFASVDCKQDIAMSLDNLRRMADPYRKVRNTFRFMLGNLSDFAKENAVPPERLLPIDRWILSETQGIIRRVTEALEEYEFHAAVRAIHQFCVIELSSFYFDVLKDRLYTWGKDSEGRRSAQTVLSHVLSSLVRLVAPLLPHTAEEVWQAMGLKDFDLESIHLARWPAAEAALVDLELQARWRRLLEVRDDVCVALERARDQGTIRGSLDASIKLSAPEELYNFLSSFEGDLSTCFIVSSVELTTEPQPGWLAAVKTEGLSIMVQRSQLPRCERCWNHRESVGSDADYPDACSRCVEVLRGDAEH